jgi:hypothetical protein
MDNKKTFIGASILNVKSDHPPKAGPSTKLAVNCKYVTSSVTNMTMILSGTVSTISLKEGKEEEEEKKHVFVCCCFLSPIAFLLFHNETFCLEQIFNLLSRRK